MARRKIIAGNWKMNMTPSEAVELINTLKPLVATEEADVVFCVPAIDIIPALEAAKGSNIQIGAENMYYEEKGAFTGEISAAMLLEYGVEYVIIGHSERRQYFGETDETVNKRTLTALKAGLTPIVCIGETLDEREGGLTEKVLLTQIEGGFEGISEEDIKKVVVAYEPVWAIGTGKTATSEQANDTIKFIRKTLAKKYGRATANRVRIQYGGSMNAKNAAELMAMSDIDGGLIGGASLKAEDFSIVVKAGVNA